MHPLIVRSGDRPMQGDEEVYTTEEVAEKLRVTPKTVREWIQRGDLNAINAGQGCRIFKSDYGEFIGNRRRRKERKK
jgi:excisionase family DNA binding protein